MKSIEARVQQIVEQGNLRSIVPIVQQGVYIENKGRQMINLSSNDYLGLAGDVGFRSGFVAQLSADTFIPSASSSRLLTGNSPEYEKLEASLADSYQAPAALIFNSGYHANLGIVAALANDKNTLIIADKLIHASLIDGIKLSGAPFLRYKHNDYNHLESILQRESSHYKRIIVATESVFSMDGDRADLHSLVALKQKYPQIWLYLDEAHAVGVYGNKGLGVAEDSNVLSEIDLLVGTFGKALASIGAYLICRKEVKEFLINTMRPLIFSTALPPINISWSQYVWDHLPNMQLRRHSLEVKSDRVRQLLNPINGSIVSQSHIIPWLIGASNQALHLSNLLQEAGFYILAVRPPSVPVGSARLRISINSQIAEQDIDRLTTVIDHIIDSNPQ